jgi:hypothetical protein
MLLESYMYISPRLAYVNFLACLACKFVDATFVVFVYHEVVTQQSIYCVIGSESYFYVRIF